MKIQYYGYKEAKVQTRSMSIAELKLIVLRSYMEHGVRQVELMDLTAGDTLTFNTMEDVLQNTWSDNTMIEVINLPHLYGFKDAEGNMCKNSKSIIIFQEAEEDDDKVIK